MLCRRITFFSVKVGNDVGSYLRRIGFYPHFIRRIIIYFIPRSMAKTMGERGINWESKTLLDLDYTDEFSNLDENISKIRSFYGGFESSGHKNRLEN